MASWRTRPEKVRDAWFAYRQVASDSAPLFHSAGEPRPSQPAGRWHREGEGYAQYLAIEAAGAWAELIRNERIRSHARGSEYVRAIWLVYVDETEIADLSSFEKYARCGLDPRIAVGEHEHSQALAHELKSAGYRGLLSPSAALPTATNLTLFGERYEKVLLTRADRWSNPQPGVRVACNLIATAAPPAELITQTCFRGMQHETYRDYLHGRGLPEPSDSP